MRFGCRILVLYALITVLVVSVPFLILAWQGVQTMHSRVYWFRVDAADKLEAYLTHSLDDAYPGMRDSRYPMAVVEIETDELWYAPLVGRHWMTSSSRRLVRVGVEESFTIRIRDGEDVRANGGIWDYPPLDQRVAKKIEPGSIADEALKGQPEEMRAMLADILDGIPDPREEIEATRRDALVGAVQRALREDGFGWVADGVNAGSWSRGGVDYLGVLKLVCGVIVLIGVVVVFERLIAGRKKSGAL
tara:strand:- start:597 stop:1337 length:741 start_codon:yes stop_codon:yes gene_type:complete